MKTLNYGSLNVDYVYSLDHIVQGGETILSTRREAFCGGKGLNQSIALAKAGVNPDTRVKDLTEDEEAKIREIIDNGYVVEGDLRRDVALNIKRLVEINCYRGTRHRKGLPCRGQRTKTNARTRKGPKKTIANKKK